MRRAIFALALAACDMGWKPPSNDNNIAPLRCPQGEVEWLCEFSLSNVPSEIKWRSLLVCADGDPGARAEVKRAYPASCVRSCAPTGALTSGAGGDGPGECAACSATGEPCSADADCCGEFSLCYDGACD